MPQGAVCLLAAALALVEGMPSRVALAAGTQASSRVFGRVVDARSRAAIGAVRVVLDDGAAAAVTVTGPDGEFEFRGVAPGSHLLVVQLEGFAPSPPVVVVVEAGADARADVEYSLRVTTEVLGRTPEPPSSPIPAALGPASMSGLNVAAAVGGLDDVTRVMQLRPGVTSSQDDRNDLIVRGGGAFETTATLDGFELPTASHFAWPGAASGGLSLIPSAAIQRAVIETGGFSVAHGERASALLDVDTRTGATGRVRGRVDASAGGVMALAEGRLPGGGGEPGSWMALVRRSILEFAFSRGDSRATPGYVEAMGNVDVPISKNHRLHVLALGSTDRLDVNFTAASSTTLVGDQSLALGGVSLRSAWGPRTETFVSAGWVSNRASLSEVQQTATSFTNHSLEHFLRVRAELRQAVGRSVRLVAGVATKQSAVNFDFQDGAHRNEWNLPVPAVHASWHDDLTDAAAYADVAWSAGPLLLGFGARADRSGVTSSWHGSPRGRVEYRPGPRWRLTGSSGVYLQDIPNIWLGSNPANRRLEPVRCVQSTLGVEADVWRGFRVAAEGFVKRYSGYPIDPSVPSRVLISAGADFESPFVGVLAPSGLVRADGVDLSASRRIAGALAMAVGYSYWDVREFNLEKRWIRADFDIRHQGRVWLAWHGAGRWAASALWRYASGRPYTPYDVGASIKANTGRFDRARTNAVVYPAYHRLDIRADRAFTRGRASVSAFVEVDNVYNRDNLLVYEWFRASRQPRPIYQWGRTPVAGIRVEF